MGHEQPPAEPLFDGMEFVANSGLSNLHQKRICVVKQHTVQTIAALELPSQDIMFDAVSTARKLDDRAKGGRPTQNRMDSRNAFIADDNTSSVAPSAVPERQEMIASSGKKTSLIGSPAS